MHLPEIERNMASEEVRRRCQRERGDDREREWERREEKEEEK